jgi:hypothetical protein
MESNSRLRRDFAEVTRVGRSIPPYFPRVLFATAVALPPPAAGLASSRAPRRMLLMISLFPAYPRRCLLRRPIPLLALIGSFMSSADIRLVLLRSRTQMVEMRFVRVRVLGPYALTF